MSKTVGKSKNTKTTKTAKKVSAKPTTKSAPKSSTKATPKEAPKAKSVKKNIFSISVKSDNNVLMICVVAIVVILVVALLASAVKNRKTEIDAKLTIASSSAGCDLIVREDDGTRPASGSTIVVKDSKSYRDMLSQYSYLKKFNLEEPKDFSEASYVYIYSVDSMSEDGLRLGDVNVQNKNVNIEIKFDGDKAVDCVNAHLFVVRIDDKNVENANFSTVAD